MSTKIQETFSPPLFSFILQFLQCSALKFPILISQSESQEAFQKPVILNIKSVKLFE